MAREVERISHQHEQEREKLALCLQVRFKQCGGSWGEKVVSRSSQVEEARQKQQIAAKRDAKRLKKIGKSNQQKVQSWFDGTLFLTL